MSNIFIYFVPLLSLFFLNCRYHFVDKATVPWDWELLNTVMANQVHCRGDGGIIHIRHHFFIFLVKGCSCFVGVLHLYK